MQLMKDSLVVISIHFLASMKESHSVSPSGPGALSPTMLFTTFRISNSSKGLSSQLAYDVLLTEMQVHYHCHSECMLYHYLYSHAVGFEVLKRS